MLLASDPGDPQSILFITQSAAQVPQRNVLQLANTLTRHGEILSDFLEGLRLSATLTSEGSTGGRIAKSPSAFGSRTCIF